MAQQRQAQTHTANVDVGRGVVYEITYKGPKISANSYSEFAGMLREHDSSLVSLVRVTENSRRAINLQGTSIPAVANRIESRHGTSESREAQSGADQTYGETSRVARRVGSAFAEVGERVLSSIVPRRTEGQRTDRPAMSSSERERMLEVIREFRETTSEPEKAENLRSGQADALTVPGFRSGEQYGRQFEIIYNESKLGEDLIFVGNGMVPGHLFDDEENRGAIVRFRSRLIDKETNEPVGGWSGWFDGRNFHSEFMARTKEKQDFVVRSGDGKITVRFSIYINPEHMDAVEQTISAIERAPNPIEMLRALNQAGYISGFSSPAGDTSLSNLLNRLESIFTKEEERRKLRFVRS